MNYERLIGQKDKMTERQKDKKIKRTQNTYNTTKIVKGGGGAV